MIEYISTVTGKKAVLRQTDENPGHMAFLKGLALSGEGRLQDGTQLKIGKPKHLETGMDLQGACLMWFTDKDSNELVTSLVCWDERSSREAYDIAVDLFGLEPGACRPGRSRWVLSRWTRHAQEQGDAVAQSIAELEAGLALLKAGDHTKACNDNSLPRHRNQK